jgi:GNAT superfamily N-acetyltransferase
MCLRRITAADRAAVEEISKGIYGGNDYLVSSFDKWAASASRHMLGLFSSNGQLVALEVLTLFDGGKSAMFQALRVHPAFRGKGFAKQITAALKDEAGKFRSLERMRVCCHLWADGPRSATLQKRNGFIEVMRLNVMCVDRVLSERTVRLNPTAGFVKVKGEELWNLLMFKFPERLLMFDWEVRDITLANLLLLEQEREVEYFVVKNEFGAVVSFSLGGPSPRSNGVQTYVSVFSPRVSPTEDVHAEHALQHLRMWADWAVARRSEKIVCFYNAEAPELDIPAGGVWQGWTPGTDLKGPMCVLEQPLGPTN